MARTPYQDKVGEKTFTDADVTKHFQTTRDDKGTEYDPLSNKWDLEGTNRTFNEYRK